MRTSMYCLILFLFISVLGTDKLGAQVVISKPNLGFTQACANPNFNTYNLSFSFTASSPLGSNNQFYIELSDAEGDFTNAVEIFRSEAGTIAESPASMTFSFPEMTFDFQMYIYFQ